MKTISTLLLGILSLIISITFITFAVESFTNSNQLYLGNTSNDLYDFKFTLVFTGFILVIIAMIFIVTSFTLFKVFYLYYLEAVERKRDKDIFKQLEDAKYDSLYNNLSKTNLYDEKKRIIYDFYRPKKSLSIKTMMDLFEETMGKSTPFNKRASDAINKDENKN